MEEQLPHLKESSNILADLSGACWPEQKRDAGTGPDLYRAGNVPDCRRLNAFAAAADKVSLSLTGIFGGMEKILAGMENNRISQETAAQETNAALAEAGRIQSEFLRLCRPPWRQSPSPAQLLRTERHIAVQGHG